MSDVAPSPIADDDLCGRLAQQRLEADGPATRVDDEVGHQRQDRRPQPTLRPGLLPAGLVGVPHTGPTTRQARLLVCRWKGFAGLLLQRGDRTQRDRHVAAHLDLLPHRTLAEVEAAAEVAHHGGQAWPDEVVADLGGDGHAIEVAASRTELGVGFVLGDEGRPDGQFGDPGARTVRDRWVPARWAMRPGSRYKPRGDNFG